MSDWHDYKENLAYEPQGDWSDTQPKSCTDRTPQVLLLIDRVARLQKQLEIAVNALEDYAESDNWELENETYSYWSKKGLPYPWRIGLKALKQIKELEK